jgi:acetyl esterase
MGQMKNVFQKSRGSWVARLEPAVFRGLLGLPVPMQRLLAGRPVERDGQRLDPQTQWMLRLQGLVREPAVETLPIPQGRVALARQCVLVGGRQPIGATRDLEVPGGDGPLAARLYVPRGRLGTVRPSPLLVFFHGGGMIYGGLDEYDALCRFLAERADVRVLAVDYRLAPEHPFPAAVDDCWETCAWASAHARDLGADPDRVAVGGDSAGGYLSAVTAITAAHKGVPLRHQLLIYPVTDMVEESASRRTFAEGFFLTRTFMTLAERSYLADGDDPRDPRVSVGRVPEVPDGHAPATVVTAGFDPLRDEGEAYARRLADAGVRVDLTRYPGFIHGFANIVGAGRSTRAAMEEVAAKLCAALAP